MYILSRIALLIVLIATGFSQSREWSDSSGFYKFEADLIARNETQVVLQKTDKSLLIVEIDQLSEADKKYLESKEGKKLSNDLASKKHSFTLRNGMTIEGAVIEYARRNVTIKRQLAKIYVNDQVFDNLPEVYQRMVPQIVSHFEGVEIKDKTSLSSWLLRKGSEPQTFTCDGVMVSFDSGDVYGIPMFLLSSEDQAYLKPGFDEWVAVYNQEETQKEIAREQTEMSLRLQAEMAAEREADRDIQKMQLNVQAYDSGLFDLWEVQMIPPRGIPVVVVVPGRDSRQAAIAAQQQYPDFRVGATAKVRRRRW